jgi:hypothetical protein
MLQQLLAEKKEAVFDKLLASKHTIKPLLKEHEKDKEEKA